MFEFQEVKEKNHYDPLLISKNAPFTQAWFFGEWQEMTGRKVRRFEIRDNSETLGFFQIIKYPMPFGQSFLYIPHGPVITHNAQHVTRNNKFLEEFREKLVKVGKEENAIFIRFDLFPKTEESLSKDFKKVPTYAYHSSYFQPKFEWILNLEKPEEEILNEMHSKTRYNINLARKRGIKIEIVNGNFDKYFRDFYKLLKETAKRDNFNLHPKIYYQNIFNKCDENKNAFLSVAKYNDKILAINLILFFGNTAYFMLGGSGDEYKNLMFSHLAQWEATKEAKKRGFSVYNFGGVDGNDSYKTFGGISIFKKRFGGKLLEHSDSYDLVLKPFWYLLYNLRKKFQFN